MPQFSIIIPAFNASATLAEALLSVKNQTFTDWEALVVNDGSIDNTAKVFENTVGDDDRFSIIHQNNEGLGAARNAAANRAKAAWLVFLDADDRWAANKLKVLAKFISEHSDAEMFYHPVFELYPNGRMRLRRFQEAPNIETFIYGQNPYVPSAVAIKKEVFEKAGGFIEDINQVEDLGFWLHLLKSGVQPVVINQALTVYSMGSGLTSNIEAHLIKIENSIRAAEKQLLITLEQAEVFLKRKNYEAARQLQKLGYFQSALRFYKLSDETLKIKLMKIFCALKMSI